MARKQIISVQQAVIMTGRSERRIQLACQTGELRAEKIGRSWHIEKTSVNEYIRKIVKAEKARAKKAQKKGRK
jgi:Fic family protein